MRPEIFTASRGKDNILDKYGHQIYVLISEDEGVGRSWWWLSAYQDRFRSPPSFLQKEKKDWTLWTPTLKIVG